MRDYAAENLALLENSIRAGRRNAEAEAISRLLAADRAASWRPYYAPFFTDAVLPTQEFRRGTIAEIATWRNTGNDPLIVEKLQSWALAYDVDAATNPVQPHFLIQFDRKNQNNLSEQPVPHSLLGDVLMRQEDTEAYNYNVRPFRQGPCWLTPVRMAHGQTVILSTGMTVMQTPNSIYRLTDDPLVNLRCKILRRRQPPISGRALPSSAVPNRSSLDTTTNFLTHERRIRLEGQISDEPQRLIIVETEFDGVNQSQIEQTGLNLLVLGFAVRYSNTNFLTGVPGGLTTVTPSEILLRTNNDEIIAPARIATDAIAATLLDVPALEGDAYRPLSEPYFLGYDETLPFTITTAGVGGILYTYAMIA